jgi:hypothetical protein
VTLQGRWQEWQDWAQAAWRLGPLPGQALACAAHLGARLLQGHVSEPLRADRGCHHGHWVASEAVRVADMRVVVSEERRTRQPTLAKYLQLIGPLPEGSMFPNECRPYLAGVVGRGAQLKLLLRAGMLPLGRLESRKKRRGAASCPACGGPEEDAAHFLFTCGALHAVRDQLHSRLDAITTDRAFGQLMYDEPLDTALLDLLGDKYWGEQATAVDSCYGLSWWRPGLHGGRLLFWRWLWMLSWSLHR